MANMRWKTYPASDLDKMVKSGRVFVLNTSVLPSGDKGMIVINFYDGTRREFFKAPPTFIPMAVTDVIPAARLADSRDFKQTLVKGMLTLVDADQAETYLQTPEAQEEYDSLMLSEHSARSRNIDVESEVSKRLTIRHTSSEGAGPMQDIEAVDTVSNKVRGLMEDLNSNNKSARDVLLELRRHQTAFKPVDISYVLANATDPELAKWAEGALRGETAGKSPSIPAKKLATRPVKKRAEPAFDFKDSATDEMTPEEQKADAAARSKYVGQQALSGQSAIDGELDKLLKGQA